MATTETVYEPDQRYPASYGTLRAYGRNFVHRRVSWQALFAGLVLAIAIELLLVTLGAAVGLSTIHAQANNTPDVSSFSMAAGIWWLVSGLIALLIGGYVAARLAGVTSRFDGMLHGLIVWGLMTLFALYLLTTAVGGAFGGASEMIGGTMSAAGSTLKTAAAPELKSAAAATPGNIQSYLQPADANPQTMSPQDAQKEIAVQLPVYESGGAGAPAAKQRIIAIMAAQMHESPDAATARFDQLQSQATNGKNQAVKKAQTIGAKTAHVTSTAAYILFGMLLLGAIFGAIGGSIASPIINREEEAL